MAQVVLTKGQKQEAVDRAVAEGVLILLQGKPSSKPRKYVADRPACNGEVSKNGLKRFLRGAI